MQASAQTQTKGRPSKQNDAHDTNIDDVMPVDPNDETNRMDALAESRSTLANQRSRAARSALAPGLRYPARRGVNKTFLIVVLIVLFLFCAGVIAFVATRRSLPAGPLAGGGSDASPTSAPRR